MTFDEVLEQALEMLRRRGRVSYRALKVQFHLDDDLLEILKEEIVAVHHLGRDQEGMLLVWTGDTAPAAVSVSPPTPDPVRAPLAYTPAYLTEKILTSRAALEAERKQVTVLFADLKGSTELIEGLDPEEARKLLDPALHLMMEAVHRYEGTVNQVLGDGIMALFGAPVAHEDHAVRALQQALAQARAGHGQVVALVGEAGVGKSRLVYEFLHAHQTSEWRVLESASVSYGQATPYYPVIDLLKRYSHVEEHDDTRTIRAKVTGQVVTLDPALQDTVPALLALLDAVPEDSPFLRLDPLPPVRAEEFLQALLGDDPRLQPLTALLIARTKGNPFFLEESVRTLVETGFLGGERGAYRLEQALAGIQVPATVQALLAARIDRLPAEAKRLLQTAAVLGTEVPLPLLQAIADLPEAVLQRTLTILQHAEFLYETRLFPEYAYTFKHALTHEVAYSSLLLERRRVLHARIVEALEALAGEGPDGPAPTQSRQRVVEQVERLAHHALRGEVWAKALVYCRQAGEKALVRSAHREAVEYFEQALSALADLPETRDTQKQAIDLRLALRTALAPSGDLGRILAVLHEAETHAEALADPRRLGQVSVLLSRHFDLMGAHDQALAAAQRALALATAGGDVILQALTNRYLGLIYHAQGDYRRAIDSFGQTMVSLDGARRYERFGQVILPAVASYAYLACCHAELGTFAEGSAPGDEGMRIAEVVDHPVSLMFASWGIGLLSLRKGDLPRALPRLERAMGICQDVDLPHFFPLMASALGAAYTLGGRVADAVPLLTQAMEQAIARETVGYQALCSLPLGEAHLLAGCLEEAQALAERALALTRAHQERGHQAYALRLLGDIAARCDPPESEPAVAHYQQALTLAEELGMRPLVAHCYLGLGTLYRQMGRTEEIRAALSTAIELYRAMDMTFWIPQAEAVLAQVGEID